MQLPKLLAVVALLATAAVAHADDTDQLRALTGKLAPSVVTVNVVLTTQYNQGGTAQTQESRTLFQGVVVSPDGLVMVSSLAWSPQAWSSMFGGGRESSDEAGPKVNPKDFKVIVEKEDKEYSAFLAATDTTLGLAFLKIEGLGDRKLISVDFSSVTVPVVGQKLFGVSRLGKGFDYAPYFRTASVSGEITKPRKAYILDNYLTGLAMPVYSITGEAVGVLTAIAPGAKDDSDDGPGFGTYMRMFLGGGSMVPTFVVPDPAVSAVIGQAKARAVELAASRAAAKPSAATAPAKPAK